MVQIIWEHQREILVIGYRAEIDLFAVRGMMIFCSSVFQFLYISEVFKVMKTFLESKGLIMDDAEDWGNIVRHSMRRTSFFVSVLYDDPYR